MVITTNNYIVCTLTQKAITYLVLFKKAKFYYETNLFSCSSTC
jgi:hypothetical protein